MANVRKNGALVELCSESKLNVELCVWMSIVVEGQLRRRQAQLLWTQCTDTLWWRNSLCWPPPSTVRLPTLKVADRGVVYFSSVAALVAGENSSRSTGEQAECSPTAEEWQEKQCTGKLVPYYCSLLFQQFNFTYYINKGIFGANNECCISECVLNSLARHRPPMFIPRY
jgi:hypothetical protein